MVAFTTLAILGVGAVSLFGLYSAVSFVAHWAAVAGGIGVALALLRYLLEQRPIELTENELVDNVSYLAVSLPLGVLSFRFLNGFLQGVSILLTIAVAVVAVASVLYPGAMFKVVDGLLTLVEAFSGGE